MRLVTCAVFAALMGGSVLSADSAEDWEKMRRIVPRSYVCARATSAIKVDGKLNERAWKSVRWSQVFLDIEGSAKPIPRFRTRMKMSWDDEYLYIGARMVEPHVWGTLTEHDSVIFHDNDFEVFIDPDGDNHQYYEFEMNALNTGWDLFLPRPYKDGGRADNGWEIPGLKTAVFVAGTLNDPSDRDAFWSVEMAIPWTAMSRTERPAVAPQPGDRWRFNFSRVQWKHQVVDGTYQKIPKLREDNWVWSPQGIIDMHRPERWGYVEFAELESPVGAVRWRGEMQLRDALMTIYHRQRAYQRQHKQWASRLDQLGLSAADFGNFSNPVKIVPTNSGYIALLETRERRRGLLRGEVRQDSRLKIIRSRREMVE